MVLVRDAARADAWITHPNPVCLEASAVFAVTIAHVVREGTTPRETYDWAVGGGAKHCREADVVACLTRAEQALPHDFMHQMGFVETAFQNVFFHLVNTPTFEAACWSAQHGAVVTPIRTPPSAAHCSAPFTGARRFPPSGAE